MNDKEQMLSDFLAFRIDLTDAELASCMEAFEAIGSLEDFTAQLESGEPIEFSEELREAARQAIARRDRRLSGEPIRGMNQ